VHYSDMTFTSDPAPRLLWLALNDGRSVVAGCGSATRERVELALSEEPMLTLTSDDRVDQLPCSSVRDFAMFDAGSNVPSASAIYRLVVV